MSQNTEQNGQTQLVQIGEYSADPHTVCFTRAGFEHQIAEAEARGAAEQRRKDAEGQEPIYQYQYSDQSWCDTSKEEYERNTALDPNDTRILYTRPANVAALEARIVELEAREERDGWQYLTENTSSDSGLPSCRLNFMFQEGDSRERIEETASAFGIEVCWDVTDWDWQGPPEEMEELSADDLAKCAPRTDLTDAGWKLVDVWDTEDGEIVRMYARPINASLTREGVV